MFTKEQKRKAEVTKAHRNLVAGLDAAREGRRLEQEQQEAALRPVTNEIKYTQDAIREIKDTLNFDSLRNELEQIQRNTSPLTSELEKMHHYAISEKFFDLEPTLTIMSKHNLPHPSDLDEYDSNNLLNRLGKISRSLGGKKAAADETEREEIDKELTVMRKYRKLLQPTTVGSGVKYYSNPSELKNRLRVLVGQMRAGNASEEIQNECVEIIDRLRKDEQIDSSQQKLLYEKVYSF